MQRHIRTMCLEVLQPEGRNLEFAVCIVDKGCSASAAGYDRAEQSSVAGKTHLTDWPKAVWLQGETHMGGDTKWKADKRSQEGTHRGHIVWDVPPLNQPLILCIHVYMETLDSGDPDHLRCTDRIPLWNVRKTKNTTFEINHKCCHNRPTCQGLRIPQLMTLQKHTYKVLFFI